MQIKTLIDKGILQESYRETNRILIRHVEDQTSEILLSKAQFNALENLKVQLLNKKVVLFEGVTASGMFIDISLSSNN